MARLLTCGFEVGSPGAAVTVLGEDAKLSLSGNANATVFAPGTIAGGDPVRSGSCSLKTNQAGSSGTQTCVFAIGIAPSRTYWMRVAVYYTNFGVNPAIAWFTAQGDSHGPRLTLSGSALRVGNYSGVGGALATGPTLALNTWYVIELMFNSTTGAGQLWVDGVSYGTYTSEVPTTGTVQLTLGAVAGTNGPLMAFDDWAINDDQGTTQNGQIGNQGKIVLLKPISDNARVGFTGGAGGTTNLFQAVDNTPPVGLVLASATATSQIKDATSITTDSYTANLAAYSTAVASGGGGLAAADQITLVQGIANHANSSVTSRTNGLTVVSNPAIAEATGTTGTTAAATWPTGWTTLKSVSTDTPSVTKATSPTVKFRKGTASTDSAMASLLGLYVEYIPVLPQPLTTVAQAAASASATATAAQRTAPSAQAAATALAQVATPVPLGLQAVGHRAQATATVTAPSAIAPPAAAATQASAAVTAAPRLAPSAAIAAQATVTVLAPTVAQLTPSAQAQAQAQAPTTAAVRITPSAAGLAQASALVSAAAPPLIPVSAAAQTQATARVVVPVQLTPVSAQASNGDALVTVAVQISIIPVQASAGAGALVTVATQISVQPVQASAGAGALVTVATQISVQPVQAVSGAGALVTVITLISVQPVQAAAGAGALVTVATRISLEPVLATSDAGSAVTNVTAPVLLTSVPVGSVQ